MRPQTKCWLIAKNQQARRIRNAAARRRANVNARQNQSDTALAELTNWDECSECEGTGWVLSCYQASHAPNFEVCPECLNPHDRRSP